MNAEPRDSEVLSPLHYMCDCKTLNYTFYYPETYHEDESFYVEVEYKGTVYKAEASTKEQAKIKVARKVIDDIDKLTASKYGKPECLTSKLERTAEDNCLLEEVLSLFNQPSPCGMLNDLTNGQKYTFNGYWKGLLIQYHYITKYNNKTFVGCGINKRLAKASVAGNVLVYIFKTVLQAPPEDIEESRIKYKKYQLQDADRYLAIDTEMVTVLPGKSDGLGRCSIVNTCGEIILNTYVQPPTEIVNYRTKSSGITPQHMLKAIPHSKAIHQIRQIIKGKVLVGHSIKRDLRVLGMEKEHPIEDRYDTSTHPTLIHLGFRCRGGGKMKLKNMAQAILGLEIQNSASGHCSLEDARATMDLFLMACYIDDIMAKHTPPPLEPSSLINSLRILAPAKSLKSALHTSHSSSTTPHRNDSNDEQTKSSLPSQQESVPSLLTTTPSKVKGHQSSELKRKCTHGSNSGPQSKVLSLENSGPLSTK